MVEVLNGPEALGYKDEEERDAVEAMLALFPGYRSKPDTDQCGEQAIPMLIAEEEAESTSNK